MKRFFSSSINFPTAILEGKEKEHCIKVLRTQLGEQVEIVDGQGSLFVGELGESDKHTAIIRHLSKVNQYTDCPLITIACCIPKNASRWEFFLEKATEIGVKKIIPLIAKRSEKSNIRHDRNEQILISALKQSGHLYLPELEAPQKLNDFIKSVKDPTVVKFIAHCDEQHKEFLGHQYKKGEEALILIGPEGDFTPEEIKLALSHHFKPVSLGASRLRVETAGIVAAGMINWVNFEK